MSGEDVVFLTLAMIVLGAVVVAANIADHRHDPWLRQAVLAVLLLITVLIVLTYGSRCWAWRNGLPMTRMRHRRQKHGQASSCPS